MGLHDSRNGCILQGAVSAIRAIGGFVPIVHSTIGCSFYAGVGQEVTGTPGVCTGAGGLSFRTVPCSNIIERQVIFGGGSRLREQISNTVKVLRGDAYVVLSGCATEIVGDDIPYMVKESRQQGYPTIHISAAGFRGNACAGYEAAVLGILEQLELFGKPAFQSEENTVNLLGVPPVLNPYWVGSLRELSRILENLGLRVNRLFGPGSGIEEWKQFPDAAFNFVFSGWGLSAAQYAKEHFGTPFLEWDGVPLGSQTGAFLEQTAALLGISNNWVKRAIKRGEDTLSFALNAIGSAYYTYGFQKEFVLVADAALALAVVPFLEDTLGLPTVGVAITDGPGAEAEAHIREVLQKRGAALLFSEDTAEIADFIEKQSPELILGSLFERAAAEKLKIPLFELSFPETQRILLTKSLAGYEGAVSLTEDLFSFLKNYSSGGR